MKTNSIRPLRTFREQRIRLFRIIDGAGVKGLVRCQVLARVHTQQASDALTSLGVDGFVKLSISYRGDGTIWGEVYTSTGKGVPT